LLCPTHPTQLGLVKTDFGHFISLTDKFRFFRLINLKKITSNQNKKYCFFFILAVDYCPKSLEITRKISFVRLRGTAAPQLPGSWVYVAPSVVIDSSASHRLTYFHFFCLSSTKRTTTILRMANDTQHGQRFRHFPSCSNLTSGFRSNCLVTSLRIQYGGHWLTQSSPSE